MQLAVSNSAGDLRARRAELEANANQKVLDTPRTREACKKLGLVLEDLQFRGFDSFAIPGDMKDKQMMRFVHYEEKRKNRLAQVLAERAKVIATNAKKGEVPGAQSAQFLSMLESLFEKEAKRLETDLKSQLRQHSALVRENEDQLRKEEQLQVKLDKVEQKRTSKQEKDKEKGQQTRARHDQQRARTEVNLAKYEEEFATKQMKFAQDLLAEEERMERFNEMQAVAKAEKSAHWLARVNAMKERSEENRLLRQKEAEARLQDIETRILEVQGRREEEQRQRQMKSEMQHLHIMDVRDAKNQLDRKENYRREELKEQIDGNVERIETLLALKEQLLNQRRARTLKAEASAGSRGLNLRRDCLPGPGQYEVAASCMTENPAPKMSTAQTGHSEFIDAITRVTAANPAPGAYDGANRLKDGTKLGEGSGVPAFGKNQRDSFLDQAVKAKESVPEPGRYKVKAGMSERGTKMARARIQDSGLDKYSAKQYSEWQRPTTETPGPAGYNVDSFLRKEVVRKAQRSLPNLTKDMLRARTNAVS